MCLCAHKPFRFALPKGDLAFSPEGRKRKNRFQRLNKNSTMKNEFIKIRVSRIEKKIIERKSNKAGLSVSEFVRRLAFEKELKSRLSEEEIECYKSLSKYADNFRRISNLFKLGDVTGMKQETMEVGRLIREHLKKFQ
jgi:hypothetical protein